jgi:hypothetical protein
VALRRGQEIGRGYEKMKQETLLVTVGQFSEEQLVGMVNMLNDSFLRTTEELNLLRGNYTAYLYHRPKPRWYLRLWYWVKYRNERTNYGSEE